MELTDFRQTNSSSMKLAGPCLLGGRELACEFDRSAGTFAFVTLRAAEGGRLPPAVAGVRTLTVLGNTVPVSTIQLENGSDALRGSIDPGLVQAVLQAAPEAEAPEAEAAAPEGAPAGPAPGAAPAAPAALTGVGALIAKLRELEPVEAEIRTATKRVLRLERSERNLAEELEEVRGDLKEARTEVAELQKRLAGVGPQIREIMDRDGI